MPMPARVRPPPPPRGAQRQVAAPAAVATQQQGSSPLIKASRDSSRIVHREFITNVTGTTAFTVAQALALNPGLQASFPWLSSQAQGWETYRFNRLRFCYYTRTGSNVPGSVLLIPDYDAADAAPATEQVASTYEDIAEDAPWKDICCELRRGSMNSLGPKHFVRTGALGPNQDIKTFDVGNLYVATVDGTAVSWGKLWVEYDVEFFTPQLPPTGLPSASATVVSAGGTIAAATPLGAAPLAASSSLILAGNAASAVVNISGMIVGTEYVLSAGSEGTVITGYQFGTPVGLSLKTQYGFGDFNAAGTQGCAGTTCTATATSGSITLAVTATTVTRTFIAMAAIPTSSL
jgi:hypothetical protein